MPQYGVKGGKMGKKQQKRPCRNYLRISQAIHVMKLNCFLTEFVRTYLNLKLEKKKRFFFFNSKNGVKVVYMGPDPK